MRGLALLALAVPAAASVAEGAEGARAPIFTVQPPDGTFLDDGFALSDDGRALAYATTDGARAARLHAVELGPGRAAWTTAATPTVKSLHWVGADAVLVIGRGDAGGEGVPARFLPPHRPPSQLTAPPPA